ncbi:MAG: DUF11 domain-containing protein [Planctomycetaceae bacterium]|jgi:uncharacterized repeat protein (TIGR01451 family)|nr:DUF11 domain-containing protein [Planctomycetaceae bacterium]
MTRSTFTLGFAVFIVLCGLFFFCSPKTKAQDYPAPQDSGQTAQSRLIPQSIPRRNPLRNNEVPAAKQRQNELPIRQVLHEVEETVKEPEAVKTGTAVSANTGTGSLTAEPAQVPTGFDDFPPLTAPPAAAALESLDDLMEPAQTKPTTKTPAHATAPIAEKKDLQPAERPAAALPLTIADPFAETQSAATVPSSAVRSDRRLERELAVQEPMIAVPDNAVEGTGTPGASSLEGPQVSYLTIQKIVPGEVITDQPVTIKTVIQNSGKSTARKVIVTDQVPKGCKLLATVPEAVVTNQNELRWMLGNLAPNDQVILETKVVPFREGEIGSVASVFYSGEASARVLVTRPMIKVEVKAPQEVQLGQTAQLEITISNPGTAAATGIVLEEHVPDGLYHKDGRILINKNVKTLKPKEAKKLVLPLTCTGSGNLVNKVVVKADGNLMTEETTAIQASAPILSLRIAGSKQRFLDLQSEYRLQVANTGNAAAKNVDLELVLPPSVKFVKTNQSGVYEQHTHSVRWALEELPAQESGEIELLVIPTQIGEQSLKFSAKGQNNLRAEAVLPVLVDGLPALSFEIIGSSNLVEAGKDAIYEIRVVNKGTKAASNVKVSASLGEGMALVKADGGRYQSNGGVVQYETLPLLEAKEEKVFKVAARCQNDGDYRVRVQVISDDLRAPITKEESTRVFR